MKLKYYGYREAKVQTRKMSIAELKLIILRSYMEHGVREVDQYLKNNMNGLLNSVGSIKAMRNF